MNYRANLWKIYLFTFFSNLHFIGGVLIPFYTDWGGINFTQILLLQSWFMLWVFLLEIPTGTVADYLSRKISLVLSGAFGIAAVLIYTSTPNIFVFMLGEFLFAFSVALLSGANEAFVYDTLRKTDQTAISKKTFARLESFTLAGIMIGAPIGSFIASRLGVRYPMMFFAIPVFFALLIALTLKEPETKEKIESKRYINILKDGLRFFYKNRILKILALDMVVIATIAYFMIWLYQPILLRSNVNIFWFGFVHAALVLSQILIMNSYEKLEKWLRSKKGLIFFSALITGVMFVIGGLTTWLPAVLAVIIIGGGFGLSRRPLFVNYMNKYIPSDKRATVLSSVSMLRRFALVIINPVVGVMTDWSLNYTLIILGVIAIIFSFVSRVEEEYLIE